MELARLKNSQPCGTFIIYTSPFPCSKPREVAIGTLVIYLRFTHPHMGGMERGELTIEGFTVVKTSIYKGPGHGGMAKLLSKGAPPEIYLASFK